MKTYTLGEIVRLGLLKNRKGVAITDKAMVSRLLRGSTRVTTRHGLGYAITQDQIDTLNARWTY
jgi:hypothetical protein